MTAIGYVRPLAAGAVALLTWICGFPAHANDDPLPGTYEIRHYRVTKAASDQSYSITTYMVLKADGTYELYELPHRTLRSRGTYVFERGTRGQPGSEGLLVWKSGINHEMGRGGSYFLKNSTYGCEQCFVMGTNAVAVLKR